MVLPRIGLSCPDRQAWFPVNTISKKVPLRMVRLLRNRSNLKGFKLLRQFVCTNILEVRLACSFNILSNS